MQANIYLRAEPLKMKFSVGAADVLAEKPRGSSARCCDQGSKTSSPKRAFMPAKDPLPEMDEATLLRLQGEGFERLRVELGVKITDEIAAQVEAEWPKDEPKDGIRRNE